ncbi:MAG: UDP-glucose/GDP-mannose dehydrogenase family protein [Acidobacteriota bacterium]
MNIAVVGTGYVGLVAAACLADAGNSCIGVDIDEEKVGKLRNGQVPFYEPGLGEVIERCVREERLTFTTDIATAISEAYVIFIAVGTPENEDGSADLQHVLAVAEQIARHANGEKIVVLKSTVPVGTNRRVRDLIRSKTSHPMSVVSNPEFLKEGTAMDDFLRPDRVVLGCDDGKALQVMQEVYAPFTRTGKPILVMDPPSAEMTKYAANTMLATRISMMNEFAKLCEKVGADIEMIRRGLGSDGRIGPSFLFAGVGFGGSCFPKDIRALRKTGEENGVDMKVTRAVEEVNTLQKELLFDKIRVHFGGKLVGLKFAVWGLAFKPRTDDMREAPSLVILNRLLEAGAAVAAFDPVASPTARRIFGPRVRLCEKAYEPLSGADALIILTEWNEFRVPDFERIRASLAKPVIFDGRNLYEVQHMAELGFTYYSIGRRPVRPA